MNYTFIGGCTEGDTRLVDGSFDYEGRVEVCQHGIWGTVCDDLIDQVDGEVICRSLGYSDGCKNVTQTQMHQWIMVIFISFYTQLPSHMHVL